MKHVIIALCLHLLWFVPQAKAYTTTDLQNLTTIVFLKEDRLPSAITLQKSLQKAWNLTMTATMSNDDQMVLSSPKNTIKIQLVRSKLPASEWKSYAGISWLWQNASAEIAQHTAYLKVEMTASEGDLYDQQTLMTKAIATLLEQTASIGVMEESRYLVIASGYYRELSKNLINDELPLYLWVYFGMSSENDKNSGFTYGLQTFGLNEMEIVSSSRSMAEVQMVLYETTKTILKNKTILRDGSKISDDNQLVVSFSEGVFVQGKTLKIAY